MADQPILVGEFWLVRETLSQNNYNNKNSSLRVTPKLSPAVYSHEFKPAHRPQKGRKEGENEEEMERGRVEEERRS